MEKIIEDAYELLDISEKIYQLQESINPAVIFGDKTFLIGTEDDRDAVFVKQNCEKKDSSYYFETSEIDGVIIKRVNGNYCIKATVKYTNSNNDELWFAKIRVENSYNGDIQIMGNIYGSRDYPDYEDKNLMETLSSDFISAFYSMKKQLIDIYNQLCESNGLNSDLYDPKWVKQLKKYNN